ncbi:MAG: hypothetical protein IJM15_09220 [Erysipelotrichaceae bacterium]|nr:hypothetical protein [Erysipelotrichaceae bacterium]
MNYENRTVFTEELYREVLNHKSFSYDILVLKGLIISIPLWIAARAVYEDNKSVYNWIFCGIAVIVIPFILIGYPIIRNRKAYSQAMKISKGKQIVTEAVLGNGEITVRNSMGSKATCQYKDVTSIERSKNMLIILSARFDPIYLAMDGWKKCTAEEAIEFLQKKCPKAKYKPL